AVTEFHLLYIIAFVRRREAGWNLYCGFDERTPRSA
uniref:Secreted protein n=1 Tax=Parascaris univalens TaxID=6257 RepID=A0A915AAY1_PARUN